MNLTSMDSQLRVDASVRVRSPGVVLRDDYMRPNTLGADDLARCTGIPAWHLRRILAGAPLYAEEAHRLATALRTSPLYWLVLQACYDLERFQHNAALCGARVH